MPVWLLIQKIIEKNAEKKPKIKRKEREEKQKNDMISYILEKTKVHNRIINQTKR